MPPDPRAAIMFCLLSDFPTGRSLQSILQTESRLGELATVSAALDVLDGLNAMHMAHVYHLRIRPAAIVQTMLPSGELLHKLTEVGISDIESVESTLVWRIGRPALQTPTGDACAQETSCCHLDSYRSPEYLASARDSRTRKPRHCAPHMDLWALHVTMFQLLTGHLPFGADVDPTAPDAAVRIRADVLSSMEAPSLFQSLQIGECSDRLHRFLRAGLAKHLSRRPHATASDMRAALSETQLASPRLHFDVFLSYRVNTDAILVHQMYRELSSLRVRVSCCHGTSFVCRVAIN